LPDASGFQLAATSSPAPPLLDRQRYRQGPGHTRIAGDSVVARINLNDSNTSKRAVQCSISTPPGHDELLAATPQTSQQIANV
jgi:hypothetical protein